MSGVGAALSRGRTVVGSWVAGAAACLALAVVLAACVGGRQSPVASLTPPEREAVTLGDHDPHDGVSRAHRMPVQGIDVARYQGEIDWDQVRRAGIRFAYMKTTEGGDHVDPTFYRNWEGAARAGIARGAYHFIYWCRTASEQALWFTMAVPRDPNALPPVLDLEWNNHSRTCPGRVSRETALQKARVLLAAMEEHTGKKPIIYTDINFHRDVLEGELKDYAFWLRSVAAEPHERYKDRPWLFWQYTATGRVPGIKGPVDRNVFNGSVRDWERWLARQTGQRVAGR
jgi:lysozyme